VATAVSVDFPLSCAGRTDCMPTDEDGDVIMTDASEAAGEAETSKETPADAESSPMHEGAAASDEGPPPEERVIQAEASKEEGNVLLKAGDSKAAVAKYAEGITSVEPLLEKDPGELGEELQRRATVAYQALRLNSAQACIKCEDWLATIEHAEKVLVIDKDNTKALYRRGLASSMMNTEGRLEQARADFARVATLEPANREVRDQLAKTKDRLKDLRAEEKQRLSAVMSGGLYKDHHAKLGKQQAGYEAEVFRRKEAEEDEISFDDWMKREKDKVEDAKKKQKEAEEKKRDAEQERVLKETHEQELSRRREAGEEEISFEAWMDLQKAKENERRRSLIGGVVRTDMADLDADERKLLEETKSKGYYHGRLGTVLSDAAPKPQQVQAGELAQAQNGQVGSEWNQAGTWEEKDQTSWVKERLTAWLQQAMVSSQVNLPSGSSATATAKVTKVKSLTGDAQLVWVRKQAKHGYNFEADLSFNLSFGDGKENSFSGSLSIPELVDTVQPSELRVDVRWKGSGPSSEFLPLAGELMEKLRESVRFQVSAFRDEYLQRR